MSYFRIDALLCTGFLALSILNWIIYRLAMLENNPSDSAILRRYYLRLIGVVLLILTIPLPIVIGMHLVHALMDSFNSLSVALCACFFVAIMGVQICAARAFATHRYGLFFKFDNPNKTKDPTA